MTIMCLSFKQAGKRITEIIICNWIVEFEESIETCSFFHAVIESERGRGIGMAATGPTEGGHLIYPSPGTVPFWYFKGECLKISKYLRCT